MNRLSWIAIPALLAGCVVTTDNNEPGTGALDFQWSFDAPNGGSSCADADVQQIQITIGSSVQTFPCNDWASGNGQSATIDDIPSGSVSFSISGLSFTYDDNGNVTGQIASYQATSSGSTTLSASVVAGANNVEAVTLDPISATQSASNIVLLWTFAGQSCLAAGVNTVNIQITAPPDSVNTPFDCDTGGIDGASVGASTLVPGSVGFTAGGYPFVLAASGSSASYYASGTLYANGYSDTTAHIDLGVDSNINSAPAPGTGTLTVDLSFGSANEDCTVAGVDTLEYYLTDDTGAVVSGTFNQNVPCTDPNPPAVISASFQTLNAPNTYFLNVEAQSGGATSFEVLQYALEVYPGVTSTYAVELPAVASL